MSLYAERHGMRTPIEKTYNISVKEYSLLFDCCSRYLEYLSWKYPQECPDGNGCCGLDWTKFSADMVAGKAQRRNRAQLLYELQKRHSAYYREHRQL